jgi:hypothetical protein
MISKWLLPSTVTSCILRLAKSTYTSSLDYRRLAHLMERHPNLGYTRVIVLDSSLAPEPSVQHDYVCVRGVDGGLESRFKSRGLVEEDARPWTLLWSYRRR